MLRQLYRYRKPKCFRARSGSKKAKLSFSSKADWGNTMSWDFLRSRSGISTYQKHRIIYKVL